MAKGRELRITLVGDTRSLDRAFARVDKKAAATGQSVRRGLMVGAAGIAATATAAFKLGKSFDEAYDTIRVGTGATGRALKGLEQDFRAVVSSTPTDFGRAGEAVAELNKRLGLSGRALRVSSRQFLELSRITGTDVSSNIQQVTRLFGDWSVATRDQSRTLDGLFRLSQSTGVTVEALAGKLVQFGSPLRQLGFDLETAASMFSRFEREGVNAQTLMPGFKQAIARMAAPTADLRAKFSELGISLDDGFGPALQGVFRALGSMTSETESAAFAAQVFGARAGPDMAAAVREGRFDLDALIATMRDGSDTILDAARDTEDFSEKWLRFRNKVLAGLEPVASAAFEGLGSAMDAVAPRAQSAASAAAGAFDKLKDTFSAERAGGAGFGAALAKSITSGLGEIDWGTVGDEISDGFSSGVDWTGKLAPAVAEGIGTALGEVDGEQLLKGLLRVVSEAIQTLFSPKFWIENFDTIFSTITIAIPIAKLLKIPGAQKLYDWFAKPLFRFVKNVASGFIRLLGQMGSRAIKGLFSALSDAPGMVGAIGRLLSKVPAALMELPRRAKSAGKAALRWLGSALGDGAEALGGALGKLIGWIAKQLGKLGRKLVEIGGRWAKDIIRGIVRGLGGIAGKVGGVVKKGLGAIGGFLGIGDGIGDGIGKRLRPREGRGSSALMGANSALRPVARLAASMGGRVSSGLRPGATTSSGRPSYHGTGEAIDIVGSPGALMRIFRTLKARAGGRFAELIYTPGGVGIKNGRPHRYSGQVAADHYDHVHAALDLGRPGPGIGDGHGKRKGVRLSKSDLMRLWVSAGGPANAANVAAAVALAESGGLTTAFNPRNSDGSVDRGPWMINSIHGALSTFDLMGNARAAVRISGGGRNWRPWVAYTSGKYRQFLAGGSLGGARGGSSGGGGLSVDTSERDERAGSRLVNRIAGRFLNDRVIRSGWSRRRVAGIRSLTRRASRLEGLLEDADTRYGQTERAFGQTQEDLGTPGGRQQRLGELSALAGLKRRALQRQQQRAGALRRAIAKYEALLRRLRQARKRARGARRAKINERLRAYQERMDELKAELKALGFEIRDTELDLGDLANEAREVAGTPDAAGEAPEVVSPVDALGRALSDVDLQERAGVITSEQAHAARIAWIQQALGGAFGAVDQRQQWELMGQLREATAQAAQASSDLTQELVRLRDEVARQNELMGSTVAIGLREAQRALADMVSGELVGHGVVPRQRNAGNGALARY